MSKQRHVEQEYLAYLKEEFNYNRLALEKAMNTNKDNADYALKLSNHMGPGSPEITEKEYAFLAMNMSNNEVQYHPNQAVLDEIISSGKLAIFKNNKLRFALSSNNGIRAKVKFQEAEHAAIRMQRIAIMNAEGNTKRLMMDGQGETTTITNQYE